MLKRKYVTLGCVSNDVGFKILHYRNNVPVLAECERCGLKFLTPELILNYDPTEATAYLRDKYNKHNCQHDTVTTFKNHKK